MNATTRLPLKLSFNLTRDDIAAFEHLPREFSRSGTLAFLATFFVTGMILAMFEDQVREVTPETLTAYYEIISVIIAAALAYGIVTLALTLLAYWRVSRAELPPSETEIDVSEADFSVRDGRPPRTVEWSNIARVIETPRHVFLCLTPRNAVIVPLRAFHSMDDMRAFADLSETLSLRADGDV
ncbi:YcxB family protein [Hyphomicrobium sp.]|jgi:hypothetical protein|uniref:YcxB family protein n=1 Tax=Hyphomicrobium sp. TaxID=82 RepID=UPI0035649FA1